VRAVEQEVLDQSNAGFWETLCGTGLAQSIGLTGQERDDLRRFDDVYLGHYPYLQRYVPADLSGKKVLEIGLGYGTLGQLLAERGADYSGADIAAAPVAMMRKRLEWLGRPVDTVRQASALELPLEDESFDYVYSIGCLHHTGDLPRSIDEVHRVLRPGGRAVVMLYNRHSLRLGYRSWQNRRNGMTAEESEAALRKMYEADARRLFSRFSRVRINVQNFDGFRWNIKREWFLGNLARVVGLDLYITADK
jgi:SAM-dependent methyltransferase